ncbi:uncharacterized protein LOC132625961 isoform X2 [Lycium barbarum]|uniref:uncharacterized protein LOC132625961 isoform X2 n=1 Tax=Lycium barbarum TaxID=112863 RepID=UPI00293EB5F0|nr:uncharacterized protein LOC132625961 isoform X2 [Lycium barbarum]XP_060196625.1 uncharacterized protein LOC132625961 isoform X2 [Lycium barbarum]XP_060196626.1 uncharacterized protein LOC132625961 isoform X2 [Lycium barbarum]
MADDDTVLMIDSLVNVLSKYDHTKYYYVGMNSECIVSNFGMIFQMALGGAGYALSYPLAQAVAENMDTCIKRHPTLYGSDHILQAWIADLAVTITLEKGFHQIDLRGDISSFLSAHPQSPFLSLHHLDLVAPIFPSMNRYDVVNHIMKAASVTTKKMLKSDLQKSTSMRSEKKRPHEMAGRALLQAGPPGTGKTALAISQDVGSKAVGDVVYIEGNSGAVKRVGRSDAFAT